MKCQLLPPTQHLSGGKGGGSRPIASCCHQPRAPGSQSGDEGGSDKLPVATNPHKSKERDVTVVEANPGHDRQLLPGEEDSGAELIEDESKPMQHYEQEDEALPFLTRKDQHKSPRRGPESPRYRRMNKQLSSRLTKPLPSQRSVRRS